jgi:hypothetical protein
MELEKFDNKIPHYPVRVWEMLLIVMGAFGLICTALIGLGNKMLNNILNPVRAEAIAESLFDYEIPGYSIGVVGVNIGAKKFAIVKNSTNPPDVIIFVSKAPLEQRKDENSLNLDIILQDIFQGNFTPTASRTENQELCGRNVSVLIQEGKQIIGSQTKAIPVVRYIANITDNDVEKNVNILANGKNAEAKALKVFNSLGCRF